MNARKFFILTASSIFIAGGIWGCDKVPYVSKFFPSKAKPASSVDAPAAGTSVSGPVTTGNVLAKVGNWTLTVEEFNERLKNIKEAIPEYDATSTDAKKLVLDELVNQQLLVQYAQDSGIDKEKNITDTMDEFRRQLLVREAATRMVKNIDTSITEAQEYYDKNKAEFADPTEWHIREIVVPTEAEAKDILIGILGGADFATTATARSKSATAAKGGDLGFLKALPPHMEAAVKPLEAGGVTTVFKGPEGFYIVKVEEKKGGNIPPFSQVSEDIKKGLTAMKQQQEVLKKLDELKQKANPTINEGLLK